MDEKLRSRIGKFKIDLDAIASWDDKLIFRIMSQCIIIRARGNYSDPVVEYTAYSPLFDEVLLGTAIPEYLWQYDSETEELKAIHEPSLMENMQIELDKAQEKIAKAYSIAYVEELQTALETVRARMRAVLPKVPDDCNITDLTESICSRLEDLRQSHGHE